VNGYVNRRWLLCTALYLACPFLFVDVFAADWPCYKADAARSGVTEEKFEFPLRLSWVYEPSQPPCPAWPEPSREMHRVDFDYAFQPVAVNGLVYFGSSADDTIRALEMGTGRIKWRFTTGGPVRFAPHIANGKCYAASDDGFAYCLDAATGKLVWKFRAAPEDRQVVGNGRMISRWPCRSGVLVDNGVAYVTAGMWPSEGIYVYALDANTGEQLWCNDTSGAMYLVYPHGAYAVGGVAPQGYLLASKDRLLVTTGRSVPAAFERDSGRFLYRAHYRDKPLLSAGGSWATIAGDLLFNAKHGKGEGCFSETLGVAGPMPGDGMMGYDLSTGQWGGAGAPATCWRRPYNMPDRHRVLVRDRMLYALGSGEVEAITSGNFQTKWTAQHPSRVYCVSLAGDALLIGGEGTITALDVADGKQIWRGQVKGQVRGLALARRQLIAATDNGRIYCFARGEGEGSAVIVGPGKSVQPSGKTVGTSSASDILKLIHRSKITRGYALVVGAPDARLAEAVAEKTRLHVISALRDEEKVASERKRLLETETPYGSRIAVHHLEDTGRLPYASYFANVVVVGGNVGELSGKEPYRVLRPCGGLMCFAGVVREDAQELIGQADVREGEVSADGESIVLVKGKLPGAFDWDSEVHVDQRVKWPLELGWFGGPGPARMALHREFRGQEQECLNCPSPIVANGRCFAIGTNHIIAVDAYNGCELWSRWIGGLYTFDTKRHVTADDDNVYVSFPDCRLQLDAQTGRIIKIYTESGKALPSPRFALGESQTFTLPEGPKPPGTVGFAKTSDGLELTLVAEGPEATSKDTWELYFDFRPAEDRLLPVAPGALQAIVVPDSMSWRPGPMSWRRYPGQDPGQPELVIKPKEVADGVAVVVRISWEEIREFVGVMPKDFAFAATLNTKAGAGKTAQDHLFADGSGSFLGHGWAVFALDAAAQHTDAGDASVSWGELDDWPAYAQEPARLPDRGKEDTYCYWRSAAQNVQRVHPLTGAADAKLTYFRSYGCGGIISSETIDFGRSGTIGIYDLADDSGMRNFSGVRPGCGMSMVPALGLFISNEGASGCQCSYDFQTSLALIPAAGRSNEDWAIFNDRLGPAPIERIALNLGAPGDRRDEQGVLWLGIPRTMQRAQTVGGRSVPFFRVPFHVDCYDGFGPYRFNSDRLGIKGTDQPWIYASGYRGIRSASVDLLYYDPRYTGLRFACQQPPKIDGDLNDRCWDGSGRLELSNRGIDVYVREDAENVYIAYRQRPTVHAHLMTGTLLTMETEPWKSDTEGEDAPVWEDDSFEIHIPHPQRSERVKGIHLGVSSSGARYDGFWDFAANANDGEESSDWNGTWSSAVRFDANRFCVEMAIPWETLSVLGLRKEDPLPIVFGKGKMEVGRGGGKQLSEDLNQSSYAVVPNNWNPEPRPYTVRLHFAEPDDVRREQRVFHVKIQGEMVLKNMDIVEAANGRNTTLVREFKGIIADKAITVEFEPVVEDITPLSVPVINGIEVVAEKAS